MTSAAQILAEIRAVGAVAYRRGDEVRMRPARAITPALLDRVRRHKRELLAVLPVAPPEVAAPPAPAEPVEWIVSSASAGAMRLVIAASPEDWTAAVWRAAALVEVLDMRTRADRADAQEAADQLQALLGELKREGIEAWLAS